VFFFFVNKIDTILREGHIAFNNMWGLSC